MKHSKEESSTKAIIDLRGAKGSIAKVQKAVGTPSRAEVIRQVFLQIEGEQRRLGIEKFSYGDITICPR